MNSLSMVDRTSLALVAMPFRVHEAGKKYSMIESGSKSVPLIWSALYLRRTLCRAFCSSQKLGDFANS